MARRNDVPRPVGDDGAHSSPDPNYDEHGYWGMRMRGGRGSARYGWYRRDWADDLETEGGFGGIHGPFEYLGGPTGEAWWEDGGVSDPASDLRVIRDFNARSPMYDGDAIPGNRLLPAPVSTEQSDRSWEVQGRYRKEYSDRGVVDGGYSEGWARGPMRGAR